ncbi:MAG: hypothetical protein GY774_25320 [Planctomycetes bacterium]|nr:hypothetical protein [Planctomycetota bacterium]
MKFIIPAILIVSAIFVWKYCFCYYDYAVNRETTSLPYRTYYYSDRNNKNDFSTVLFSLQNTQDEFINYSKFTVYLDHLHKPYTKNAKGVYTSEIHFQNFTSDDDIKINIESIKLIHKTKKGTLIPAFRTVKLFTPNTKTKYQSRLYRKYYNMNDLPNKIIEYVYVEVLINNEPKIIEFSFPIEKKYHYSAFDIAMGV